MASHRCLSGGCSCGRNKYTVTVPHDASQTAQVFFDSSSTNRRSQATPLSAWLRIPLSWYQSSTFAFFSDESHSSIRRSYTAPDEQNAKRAFCGFCGTPLSYWAESPLTDEADYISVTLGSLSSADLRDLEEMGLLPAEALSDAESERVQIMNAANLGQKGVEEYSTELPWFETLVKGSKLGKMRTGRRKSGGDGKWTVEWEVVEWTAEDEESGVSPAKRKAGELDEGVERMEH
ncbi:Mss4-like protein [Glarea lozoyensis ATCC 20868]|uniref:Mss4-like protein n=1 Tax=Glarea lozoyensis (strain ATCC 20868 / MF5171) TaxID=1116229 RepID=S3DCG6_GLAL2|nr:Mss4-like protein [Glarea lozoyensis ATCC 20868]EPE35415.1 Mss4-like protein [Glarea lozoyensis ATCC 20868]